MVRTIGFRDIVEQIERSGGWQFLEKVHFLNASRFVFLGNYRELVLAIEAFENHEEPSRLWDISNRANLEKKLQDIGRLLHNFLSGAFSLVDHTRNTMKEFYGETSEFFKEYQARIDTDFKNSALAQFVQGLRNFYIHKGTIPTKATLSYSRNAGLDNRLFIDLEQLSKWNSMPALGKRFIKEQKEEPLLLDVLSLYAKVVVAFHDWLGTRQEEFHKGDLHELDKLQDTLRDILERKTIETEN